jgi:hypothetical protein
MKMLYKNIAVVEEFRGCKRRWSEYTVDPFNTRYNPSGISFVKGFKELGCILFPMKKIPEHMVTIDLLVMMREIQPNDIDDLRKMKHKGMKIMANVYRPLDPRAYELIDYPFSFAHSHNDMKKLFNEHGMIHFPVLHSADPEVFYHLDLDWKHKMSFIGRCNAHGGREQEHYLHPLCDIMNYPQEQIIMHGHTYNNIGTNKEVPYGALNYIYNISQINVNFHYPWQKTEGLSNVNQRTFEVAMAGGFSITDNKDVYEMFEGAIPYSSKEEWRSTFENYLYRPKEVREMAKEARNIALKKHTYEQRAREIAQNILGWEV